MNEIKILENRNREFQVLEDGVRQIGAKNFPLNIVEAGCGQRWPLKLEGIEFRLIGVDIDKDALELRKQKFDDLDQIIIRDLFGKIFSRLPIPF